MDSVGGGALVLGEASVCVCVCVDGKMSSVVKRKCIINFFGRYCGCVVVLGRSRDTTQKLRNGNRTWKIGR